MDEIIIAPYNPDWPQMAAEEASRIGNALTPRLAVRIEHFGSTSVPGLDAKPIIDLLVETPDLAVARRDAVPILEALGYAFWYDNPDPAHLFFVKGLPPSGPRTHHLHLVTLDSPKWDGVQFRDYLRAHPDEAARYLALKRDLAARFADDREAYTAGKTEYIAAVMERISDEDRGYYSPTRQQIRDRLAEDLREHEEEYDRELQDEPDDVSWTWQYEINLLHEDIAFLAEADRYPSMHSLGIDIGHGFCLSISDSRHPDDYPFARIWPVDKNLLRLVAVSTELSLCEPQIWIEDPARQVCARYREGKVLAEGTAAQVCAALEPLVALQPARVSQFRAAKQQLIKQAREEAARAARLRDSDPFEE